MIIIVFLVNAALVLVALLVTGALHLLRRSRYRRRSTGPLPLAIYDTGRSMHVLPAGAGEHVTDESRECWCHPHSSLSRRASGSLVVLVDHVARRSTARM